MSYAQSVLQPGETIVATGRLHWIIYRWAILFLVAGVAAGLAGARLLADHDTLIAITAVDVRRAVRRGLRSTPGSSAGSPSSR